MIFCMFLSTKYEYGWFVSISKKFEWFHEFLKYFMKILNDFTNFVSISQKFIIFHENSIGFQENYVFIEF